MTNPDVFNAILAMDSYNRGYGRGLNEPGNSNLLGLATVVSDSAILKDAAGNRLDSRAGFYASAYMWTEKNGTQHIAISYRGTNPDFNWNLRQFLDSPVFKDAWNGWRLAGGYDNAGQAQLALQFAEQVLQLRIDGTTHVLTPARRGARATEVDFVGHSLGGGLAGFVSSLAKVSGSQTVLYDHMPFELASWMHAYSLAFEKTCKDLLLDVTATTQALSGQFTLDLPLGSGLILATTARQFIAKLAENLDQLAPLFGGTAIHIDGEALTALRDGSTELLIAGGGTLASATLGNVLAAFGFPGLGGNVFLSGTGFALGTATSSELDRLAYPDQISQLTYEDGLTAVQKHSMALLVILEYAEKQWPDAAKAGKNGPYDWLPVARYILPAIISDEIGTALGRRQGTDGVYNPGAQLATMIAYSAINQGERPFGDTGIRALFDDASDLGRAALSAGQPDALWRAQDDLAKLAVEYAGWLAIKDVEVASDRQSIFGVLRHRYATATASERLDIDLRKETWTKNGAYHALAPDARNQLTLDFLGQIGPATLSRVYDWYKGVAPAGSAGLGLDVDRITIALSGGKVGGQPAGPGVLVAALSDAGNSVTGTAGTDVIIGGKGDDVANGGSGNDILIGGAGYDLLNGGAGDDLLIAGSGGDRLIGGPGVDTFLFDPAAGVAGAVFVGGRGNDIYDLRGTNAVAEIEYSKGDGLDILRSDADNFDYSHLKLLPDGSAPWVPLRPFAVKLVDLQPSQIKVVWDVDVVDTVRNENGQFDLLVGHLYIKNNAMKTTYFDLGIYVGTHWTADGTGNSGYYFAGSAPESERLPILFGDEPFTSIGDGNWPGMVVI